VVAVAQEDKDLETHARMKQALGGSVPFEMVCDVDRKVTTAFHQTTTYLIDERGVVREIFPGLIPTRPSWLAVLHRIDELAPEKQ